MPKPCVAAIVGIRADLSPGIRGTHHAYGKQNDSISPPKGCRRFAEIITNE